MTTDEEKEEITVKAPSKPVVAPEKKAEKAVQKALEEERFGTLQVSRRIGVYFGASTVVVGVLLLALLAYTGITGQTGWIVLSPGSAVFGFALWVFVGLVNIISGFLLMGSE
jgi:hypothetical protein